MVFTWLRTRRRARSLRKNFPHEWRRVLERNVRHAQYLDAQQRDRLEGFVQVTLEEKDWAGGGGFQVTDEMRVTIAGYAAVMTLGLDQPYYFDRLQTIIIYPGAYQPHASAFDQYAGIMHLEPRLGESLHRGPVVLSWSEIINSNKRRPGNNLVIHEFAHHVDGLNGDMDGTPPIVGREQERTWYRVTEAEFERLACEARRGEATLLDCYGASNRAEFFAVASECFFERPRAMRRRHPELYAVLANFYCQDIAAWLPDAAANHASQEPQTQ